MPSEDIPYIEEDYSTMPHAFEYAMATQLKNNSIPTPIRRRLLNITYNNQRLSHNVIRTKLDKLKTPSTSFHLPPFFLGLCIGLAKVT